jgi:hypothetical protein
VSIREKNKADTLEADDDFLPPEAKGDENEEGPGYWLVGALWSEGDQLPRFLKDNLWESHSDDELSIISRVKIGDRLTVKAALVKSRGLPFDVSGKINRGNPAQILGEMLTLLEHTKRRPSEAIELAYGKAGERVYIPDNLYVIGTMNLADRSLAIVDLACAVVSHLSILNRCLVRLGAIGVPAMDSAPKSSARSKAVSRRLTTKFPERFLSVRSIGLAIHTLRLTLKKRSLTA